MEPEEKPITLEDCQKRLMIIMASAEDPEEYISGVLKLRRDLRKIGWRITWIGPLTTYVLYPAPTVKKEEKKDENLDAVKQ